MITMSKLLKIINISLVVFIIFLVILFLSSCIIKDSQKIPAKPTKEITEQLSQNAEIIYRISKESYDSGLEKKSKKAEILKKCSISNLAFFNYPVEVLDYNDEKEMKELYNKLYTQEKSYRDSIVVWEGKISKLSQENSSLKVENTLLSSFKKWFYISIIVIVLGVFFLPVIFVPLLKYMVGRVRQQFSQVVEAIENHKEENPEDAQKLLNELSKRCDRETKKTIKVLKSNL